MKTNVVINIDTNEREYKRYFHMDLEEMSYTIYKTDSGIYELSIEFGLNSKCDPLYIKNGNKEALSKLVNKLRGFLLEGFETEEPAVLLYVTATDEGIAFETVLEDSYCSHGEQCALNTARITNDDEYLHIERYMISFDKANSIDGFII